MQKLAVRIWKEHVFTRFPKVPLLATTIISFELGVSIIGGYLMARFLAGARTHAKGRIPSLRFRVKTYKVHLHHWFVCLGILALAFLFHFFLVTPQVFYGFLGGAIVQGVVYYDDWTRIVSRS